MQGISGCRTPDTGLLSDELGEIPGLARWDWDEEIAFIQADIRVVL